MITFHQLIGEGGKEGARETFERLVGQLVRLQHLSVRRVEAHPGDWGLDVFAGELDGVISVWQSKFFIDGVGEVQKSQIRSSFAQVVKQASEEGFTVEAWTLCVPVELDAKTLKWWQGWAKRQKSATGIEIELWDRLHLETLLISPDADDVRRAYFPTRMPPGTVGGRPDVLDVPDGLDYQGMLFVKQLEAAQIYEVDSAKQQFFNAEMLSREVADKRVPAHVSALQAEHADLRSIWEDRYNGACAEGDAETNLLPGLHPAVMEAIERRHDAATIEALPMHLVHRKGAMHQVVEDRRAGWTRGFRAIADAHGD